MQTCRTLLVRRNAANREAARKLAAQREIQRKQMLMLQLADRLQQGRREPRGPR